MDRRRIILAGAVLLLVGINAWHWWPTDGAPPVKPSGVQADRRPFNKDDFRLRTMTVAPEASKQVQRNLFQPRIVVAKAPEKPKAPPVPPPKTPEQLAEEAARAELAQIKLVGVVFRGDQGEAFMTRGDQTFLAHTGDKVGERFVIDKISPEGVQLSDPATKVSGQLQVSGK